MPKYKIPANLRTEDSDLLSAFEKVAGAQGLPKAEAQSVFHVLPVEIKNAPVFKDKLRDIWRYEYGLPYTIGSTANQSLVVGTNIAHKVSVLLNGVRALRRVVSDTELRRFCKKLKDKRRHLDFLSELDPIMRPSLNFTADYEPQGYARGGRKIDWHIKFQDGTGCLIDVKHRIKGLINHMNQLVPALNSGSFVSHGPPLPEGLFKSSETKFLAGIDGRWQGVWILTNIYYDEGALKAAFASLGASRIQFAVLTHFEGEARIFAKSDTLKDWLKEKFCLVEMGKR